MLASAVRRTLPLALSKDVHETQEIVNIITKHSTSSDVKKIHKKPKVGRRILDPEHMKKVKDEERTLRWWLDQSDPGDLFRSNDQHQARPRNNLIKRVSKTIKLHFGEGYSVNSFGSVRYGATSANSDMDLIVFDPQRMGGFDPPKTRLPRIYQVKTLAGVLKHAKFVAVQAIPASVPIVKFRDPKTGIKCDINVNGQPGYWNSVMIGRYAQLCPHLTGLMLAIKRWSRPIGLNSPSSDAGVPISLSSYALALMTIGFLQYRGLLPNLQENITADVKQRFFWNQKPVYRCDMRFNWHVTPIAENMKVSTASLFLGWLNFWAEFDPEKQMVDICQGGIVPRDKEGSDALYVMDPFVRVLNVPRNVSKGVFERFQKECGGASAEFKERSARSGYVIV